MPDVWDKTTPLGTDNAREGDDRIREMKSALETALSHEGAFPGASPSTAPIFIPGFPKDTTANRPTGDDLVNKRFFCNTTLNVIERYNGLSWDPVATLIPPGTKMVFFQAAVPTGWTKDSTNSGRVLRVTNGSGGGTGGSADPASAISLAHSHTVNGHTHDLANHTHTGPSHTHDIDYSDTSGVAAAGTNPIVSDNLSSQTLKLGTSGTGTARTHLNLTKSSGTGNTGAPSSNTSGSASPGTDSQLTDITLAYMDVLIGVKD